MWFVGLGVLLLVMNLANIGPVGAWTWENDWWLMLAPFGLAVVWWMWADATGWNKRRAMEKIDARREERRRKNLDALGLGGDQAKKRR
ncbi:MAG: TIGR04438 family Trp-rich protein [Aquabacterium sp.]|jgi:small Trp-rich protein